MNRVQRSTGGRPPIRDYVIRVGPAIALIPVLREGGFDPEPVLNEAGLSVSVFEHPDNVVPFVALCRALRLVVERSGLDDIGLRAGMRADLRSLGVLGYFVANSATVGRGLRALSDLLHVHDQGAAPCLVEAEGIALLGYEVLDPGIAGAEQMCFGALAIAANILRTLCGSGFELRAVSFCCRSPADPARFRKFFSAPVRFNAECNTLAFDAHWLHRPIEGADAYMHELLDGRLKDSVARQAETFEERFRRVIRTLLASGCIREDDVARAFGMSRRTLARRLRNSGTDFRSEVDGARFSAARVILESSDTAIDEIAARLGYSDPSAFARAFRRWSGSSPAVWRRCNGKA